MADTDRLHATSVQKVVVVDGNAEVLGMLEAVLDAGRYDMVFVESSDHAYSQIKKVLPNLVIVCARMRKEVVGDARKPAGAEGIEPSLLDGVE